jgi:hypothetical protein
LADAARAGAPFFRAGGVLDLGLDFDLLAVARGADSARIN